MAENTEYTETEEIQEPVSIDWQQGKALGSCLVEIYDRRLWTDVKFRCKDHEENGLIEAHKIILAARSPVFQAMFFGPCADGTSEVDLSTTERETFDLFLRYLYSDRITLSETSVIAVLAMAHLYQVSNLVEYCAAYLATVIGSSNVCEFLCFAMQLDLTDLKNICCSYIDNHAELVLNSDGILDLSSDCLLYILKGDTLHAAEDVILNAAERWARKKLAEREVEETGSNIRNCLGESFYQLRLPTMSSKSLLESVSKMGYFSVEEYAVIAAYAGKAPDVTVATNSCVGRVPKKETIIVETIYSECIEKRLYTSFEISITKDVALSRIKLCEMRPYMTFRNELFRHKRIRSNWYEREGQILLSNYREKAIQIQEDRDNKFRIDYLESFEGIDFSTSPALTLSGNVTVRSQSFESTFDMRNAQFRNNEVLFKQPIDLKCNGSPYLVTIDAAYSGISLYDCYINIKRNSCGKSYASEAGHIHIRSKSDSLAGIKSIEFLNFSNRDLSED